MTRPIAEVASVSALAIVLTLVIAAPVLRAPSERVFGREIVGRHHDPFTVMAQFARPVTATISLQPLTDIPGAVLARLSGPVAAYNWLVLLTFPLSAAAAFLLARHLALSPPAAAIAAIAFAFSPFHLAHAAYHPHIAQTQWVALYFFALWRCLDETTPMAVGVLALSVAGVALSNFYGGLIAAVVTPIAIAAYWFFSSRRQPGSSFRLAATASCLAAVAVAGVTYIWLMAPAVVADRAAFAFAREDLFRYSAKWWSYLIPPVANPLIGSVVTRVWDAASVHEGLLEQQVSLGWGVVALGVIALSGWILRDRHTPAVAAAPLLALVAFAALVCSLSPERVIGPFTMTRPSAILYGIAPMFRSYARFGVVVQLMAALLAGIGAERLWRHGARTAGMACVALVSLAAAEYLVWPQAQWRDVLPTAAHRWVMRQSGPIHALDCAPLTPDSASVEWLTGQRVAVRDGRFDDCAEPNLGDKLSASGYTHLLARRGGVAARPSVADHVPEGLQRVARFADSDVFAVNAWPPAVYTSGMIGFYPRERDAAWTWRWMAAQASWQIVNTTGKTIAAVVDIEMSSLSGTRRVILLLDGREMETVTVAEGHRVIRAGALVLTPGSHDLTFRPVDPPAVAGDVTGNDDRRSLTVAVGTWRWLAEGDPP